MYRSIIACVTTLAFFHAIPCLAQVDLKFPTQPEREVKLPGRGAFTGARFYAPEASQSCTGTIGSLSRRPGS